MKQINEYSAEYHINYSTILKTLQYWYDIEHHDVSKANEGIGIVPYILPQAKKYYTEINSAIRANEDKDFNQIINNEAKVIQIDSPRVRVIHRHREFDFLDEEENNE